ncbi:MAG: cbb3-type cytochrome c oxidase N-terminal domain-containing protein [Planctomycetia bacterium]
MSDHDHDVHVHEGPGIEEGNAPVPGWYKAVLLGLGVFCVVYIVSNLSGWNPWAAQWK